MTIIKDDSRPWSWYCDPCGESADLFETGEAARDAAEEHEIDVEARLNAHLYERVEREPDYEPMADAEYAQAECEILVMDARQTAIESRLIEIRELIREGVR